MATLTTQNMINQLILLPSSTVALLKKIDEQNMSIAAKKQWKIIINQLWRAEETGLNEDFFYIFDDAVSNVDIFAQLYNGNSKDITSLKSSLKKARKELAEDLSVMLADIAAM